MADLGIAMHSPSSLVQCQSHIWCHLSFCPNERMANGLKGKYTSVRGHWERGCHHKGEEDRREIETKGYWSEGASEQS